MAEVTSLRNNALPYPVYGAPWGVAIPILDADGDLVTGAAGLDSMVSKNGDTFAACTNEATEIATSSGVYYLLLTATEMTADVVTVIVKTSTSGAKTTTLTLYPRKLVPLRTGTAAGGAVGYITLDASAGALDDLWNGCLCVAVIDTVTEARIIDDYTGSNQQASVTPDWNTAPDSDDTFTIYLPEGRQIPTVNTVAVGGTSQTARDLGASVLLSSGTGTGQISLSSGAVTVGTNNDKTGYTASTVSDKTGYSLAADQAVNVTKWGGTAVASAYVQANTVQFAGQTITCAGGVTIPAATLASTANITAAAGCVLADSSSDAIIADAVWNAATASYGTSGTYGEALEAVGSAADPWLTNLPGSYGSGTAGYIVGTNLNATVSSRSSQTSVDTVDDFLDTEVAAILAAVDTEVAAIKAKTDNLPASPAAVGSAMTLANDSITADAIAASGANEIADALLDRDMSAGSDSGSATVRTPRQALRFLRNKWGVVGTDLTVCKEDDTATSWTATITTSASAEPIVASDPASS